MTQRREVRKESQRGFTSDFLRLLRDIALKGFHFFRPLGNDFSTIVTFDSCGTVRTAPSFLSFRMLPKVHRAEF